MTEYITMIVCGFSIVIAILLLLVYWLFLTNINKSWFAKISAAGLLLGLCGLQLEHLSFLDGQAEPLDTLYYRGILFLLPLAFYFFSRAILFDSRQFKWLDILHFIPFLTVFFIRREVAIPMAFLLGSGYCFWLVHLIYHLKAQRKQYAMEIFFFGFFAFLAVLVLIFGFSLTYIDSAYFYYFYANGIGLSFILVTGALIVFPDLLNELSEVVKLSYNASTLNNVNVEKSIARLEQLMKNERLYQNEALNLSLLAQAMDLTSHQLSELINTHYGMNFSKYIRCQRVDAAKSLLLEQPQSSILSIGLETGFKSQSSFYAAFKALTELSPGQYRKSFKSS